MTRNVEELFGGVVTAPHQIPFTYKSSVGGETFISLPFYPVTGVVTINGGMQVPLDNFEIDGNTLNLGRALSKDDVVYCLFDKILSPEDTSKGIRIYKFQAVGGETEFTPDFTSYGVQSLYIGGEYKTPDIEYSYNSTTGKVSLQTALTAGVWVVAEMSVKQPNISPAFDRSIQEIARSANVKDSEVIVSTDTISLLDDKKVVYDSAAQIIYGLPIIPDGSVISSVSDGKLTYNPGDVQVDLIPVPTSAGALEIKLASEIGANGVGVGDTTVGEILKQDIFVIGITGQSNAAGSNNGGPNPASDKVVVWNGSNNTWGSSDYTQPPFSMSTPTGNNGNNNVALAFAHRLVDEHKAKKVYIIYDAVGGRSITDWMGDGVNSVRYASFKTKVESALTTPELVAAGKTKLDFLIWFQGEEDALTDNVTTYRDKFRTLDLQFRAESWMTSVTPMFVMGMSGLHTRYQVWQAQLNYCENYNRNCIYVNSAGLKTQYDIDQTGDYTHFLGQSLWEHGYDRIWNALNSKGSTHRSHLTPFYARGAGPWKGESDAIALFSSLISIDSATNNFPLNGPAAQGSISWGLNCSADGNYTMAGGHTVATDNTCNYSIGWGREITFGPGCAYSASFGYRHTLNQWGQFAAGVGHNLSSSYECALGRYSLYTTEQANKVIFQFGIGLTKRRKNAVTIREDGAIEMSVKSAHDPAQNGEMVIYAESNTSLRIKVRGTDGVVRSAVLPLS
ncbi:tail fiber protein [Salmonella phage Vi01]|uniref:Maturation/adhesion protein n=1 Tax=Salmonella phage ViI TaxID=1987993 RepID=E1XTI0_BPSAV|nr:tail fiber protein [Salmonella phage Vi01]CBW38039.1 maturation/adhesion protein [Salmonella phage Vi01]